jgi:outer membrane immunogenic protein
MKTCILGMTVALALATGNAAADGIQGKGRIADTSHADDTDHSWRGVYVGLHAGLATGNTQGRVGQSTGGHQSEVSLLDEGGPGVLLFDYEMNGALYGVQAGWLGQWGNVVAGVEASYSGSSVQGSDAGCLFAVVDCRREVNWLATVVGRAGWAYDRVLLYGLAGVAWADVDTEAVIFKSVSLSGGDMHFGWTAGFGLEWALSNRVSARIEYAHIDLGRETHNLTSGYSEFSIPDKVDLQMDTIRLGVNVKLGHHQ